MMIRLSGLALACCAVPAAASAASVDTTLRVETSAATVVATTHVPVDPASPAVTVLDSADADSVSVGAASALAQLASLTTRRSLALGIQVFPFGTLVDTIGSGVGDATTFWRFKVNDRVTLVGASDFRLHRGDRVSWSLVSDWEARELGISVPGDLVRVGTRFAATVRWFDNTGARSPAAGVAVTYRGRTKRTDAAGKVTFTAESVGAHAITARATPPSGVVRSETISICTVPLRPRPCPPVAGTPDVLAPESRVLVPEPGSRVTSLRQIAGVVHRDRSGLAGVEVAVARRTAGRCRFLGADGALGPEGPCSRRRWLAATRLGHAWSFEIPGALPAGSYAIWSRSTDRSANRERYIERRRNLVGVIVLNGATP